MKIAWLFVWLTLPLLIVTPVIMMAALCVQSTAVGEKMVVKAFPRSRATWFGSMLLSRWIEHDDNGVSPQAPVTYI